MSGVPRHMAGWPFLRGQPLLRRLLRPVFRRFSAGAPLLCSRSACRFSAAFTQTLLCLFVWPALPARRALCARSSVLFWLSVCLFRVGCTRVFLLSFIFCLFLFGCCLSNFFSFVAQAATGISLLVPSRGFVPGLRVLSPAAFSRAFAPGVPAFFCRCSAALSPACGQPAVSALGLACAAGACLPFARHALVCAGLLLPLFGLSGSLHRGAGRCRRPAAVREASRSHVCLLRLFFARIPRRCFLACVFCRFCVWLGPACVAAACCLPAARFVCACSLSCLSPFPA